MPAFPDEKAVDGRARLAAWFTAEGQQPPVVVVGGWEEIGEQILSQLTAKDRYILELEKDQPSIAIESVRKMMSATASTTPFGKRLIVIPTCERLSLPAAQALLKFLEEPTAGNRILLVTKFPNRLLPTIRSRVQIIRVMNIPEVSRSDSSLDSVKLLTSKNRRGLTDEELSAIRQMIEARLNREGASGPTYRALLRLRDYYKIRSLGGNEKMAADVLLANLLELEGQKR